MAQWKWLFYFCPFLNSSVGKPQYKWTCCAIAWFWLKKGNWCLCVSCEVVKWARCLHLLNYVLHELFQIIFYSSFLVVLFIYTHILIFTQFKKNNNLKSLLKTMFIFLWGTGQVISYRVFPAFKNPLDYHCGSATFRKKSTNINTV